MNDPKMRIPGPDHPITIKPSGSHVVVRVAGSEIANTKNALTLQEASYPPVLYIPANDLNMDLLRRTDHSTYCPYKGQCAYYDIALGGEKSRRSVWVYEQPYAAVAAIKNHFAFYGDRVDSIDQSPL
jgi:uncharacterized protein (DUF427 family)